MIRGRLNVGLNVAAAGETPTTLLAAFQQAHPQIEVSLRTFDLTQPAAGLLDHTTDVAFVRPPICAPGISLEPIAEEPRVFVLPAGHPLARRDKLGLADVAGLPWIAAEAATDGCDPVRWRDDWLIDPRPGGEWREHVVAGHGISLCPASAETFYARPGLAFVASQGVPPSVICVAWRADDTAPTVHRFVDLVTAAAQVVPHPSAIAP